MPLPIYKSMDGRCTACGAHMLVPSWSVCQDCSHIRIDVRRRMQERRAKSRERKKYPRP